MHVKEKEEPEIVIIGASILDVLAYPADERFFRTGFLPCGGYPAVCGRRRAQRGHGTGAAGNESAAGDSDRFRESGEVHPGSLQGTVGSFSRRTVSEEDFSTGINVVLVSRDGFQTFSHQSSRISEKADAAGYPYAFSAKSEDSCASPVSSFFRR